MLVKNTLGVKKILSAQGKIYSAERIYFNPTVFISLSNGYLEEKRNLLVLFFRRIGTKHLR
jgi:hypothetical protein